MEFCFITLAALFAGIVNAIAGGGTFLSFPALTYFPNPPLDQKLANMTSTIGLWPGSVSSVVAAWKEFLGIPRAMVIAYSIISIVGGALGAKLLITTPTESFRLVIPWLLLFATVIFTFSKPISRWAGRKGGHYNILWAILVGILQFFISIYGGYFGAGIGVLMLAGLSFSGLRDIRQMNALKVLLATLINGVAAGIFLHAHRADHQIDWSIIGAMSIASVVGGFWGMAIARMVRRDGLRVVIILIGTTLTGLYFAQNYFHAFDDLVDAPIQKPLKFDR
jgi:hypothetical protein